MLLPCPQIQDFIQSLVVFASLKDKFLERFQLVDGTHTLCFFADLHSCLICIACRIPRTESFITKQDPTGKTMMYHGVVAFVLEVLLKTQGAQRPSSS